MRPRYEDTPLYREKLHKIKELVDSPLFPRILSDIRMELALEAQDSTNAVHREALFNEGQCLKRLESRLMEMANESRGVALEKEED